MVQNFVLAIIDPFTSWQDAVLELEFQGVKKQLTMLQVLIFFFFHVITFSMIIGDNKFVDFSVKFLGYMWHLIIPCTKSWYLARLSCVIQLWTSDFLGRSHKLGQYFASFTD